MVGSSVLKAEGLGRRVDGRWLWRDLDVAVAPGERVALVGPSGSGKTLLLRTLAALDPLQEGTILLDGRPLEDWEVPRYRARVSYVPQRTALAEGTVEANLRVPFDFHVHAGKAWERGRALELLAALDRSEDFLDKHSEDLSGGEEQIVALVRTLTVDPGILLLDEPAASMDAELARRAEEVVEAWQREDGRRAVVWTSHQLERVGRVADRRVELGALDGGSQQFPRTERDARGEGADVPEEESIGGGRGEGADIPENKGEGEGSERPEAVLEEQPEAAPGGRPENPARRSLET